MLRKPGLHRAQVYGGIFRPIRGWVSSSFGEWLLTDIIDWRARAAGEANLRSELECRLEQELRSDEALASVPA